MDFALHKKDLEISNGDLQLCATDSDAIAQLISIRLKTLAGEWFMDTSIGIPYLTEILGKKRNDRFLRHVILGQIETIPGVAQITDFKVQEESLRTLTISFNVILNNQSIIPINEAVEFKL